MNKKNIIIKFSLFILFLLSGFIIYDMGTKSNKEEILIYSPTYIKDVSHIKEDGTVYFSNKEFESVMQELLNKKIIEYEDINNITELNLGYRELTSIEGIELFKSLEHLNLSHNHIKDLTYLYELNDIRVLQIDNNLIKDITPLSNMVNLRILNISNNDIEDVSVLTNFLDLAFPIINGNPIMNYDVLYDLADTFYMNEERTIDNQNYLLEQYNLNKELYRRNDGVVSSIKVWCNDNINADMSDLEKEYIIINYLLNKLTFTEETSQTDLVESFYEGKAVCYNYSLLFNYMASYVGLDTYTYVTNIVDDTVENHAWNVVKINGKYYEVDLTWADDEYNNYNYDFINVSSSTMLNLHQTDLYKVYFYREINDMNKNIQNKYYVINNR